MNFPRFLPDDILNLQPFLPDENLSAGTASDIAFGVCLLDQPCSSADEGTR